MRLKLTILTLLLTLTTVPAQEFSKDCYNATQQCEQSRVAYVAGCMATGGSHASCSMGAQPGYLACLEATGCYSEAQLERMK